MKISNLYISDFAATPEFLSDTKQQREYIISKKHNPDLPWVLESFFEIDLPYTQCKYCEDSEQNDKDFEYCPYCGESLLKRTFRAKTSNECVVAFEKEWGDIDNDFQVEPKQKYKIVITEN